MLREYSDILGKPNEGVHEKRIFGLAFWDMFGTVLLAMLICYYYNMTKKDCFVMFMLLFTIGTISHLLFGVNTAFVNKILKKRF